MHARIMSWEEGKEFDTAIRTNQRRVFQFGLLQFFLLFLLVGLGVIIFSMNIIRYFGVQNMVSVPQSHFQPCFEEAYTLQAWLRPPSKLLHDMNDSQLLWRASFVPGIKDYPFRRTPKIAFMFLTKGPLPLAPLWERFFKGHEEQYSVYVHSLPNYIADFPASSVFYTRQVPSQVLSAFIFFSRLCKFNVLNSLVMHIVFLSHGICSVLRFLTKVGY